MLSENRLENPKLICKCTLRKTMTSGLFKLVDKNCDIHMGKTVTNYYDEKAMWERLGELKALDVLWSCIKDVIYYFRKEMPIAGDHVAEELLDQLEDRLKEIEKNVSGDLKRIIQLGKEQDHGKSMGHDQTKKI